MRNVARLIALVLLICPAARSAVTYDVVELATPGTGIRINGVNNAGQVVGSYSTTESGSSVTRVALWNKTGSFVQISNPGTLNISQRAFGINNLGHVSGFYGPTTISQFRLFHYDGVTTRSSNFVVMPIDGAMNNNDAVAATLNTGSPNFVRWNPFTNVLTQTAGPEAVRAMNDSNMVTGGTPAFVYDGVQTTTIPNPTPFTTGNGFGINNAGVAVGEFRSAINGTLVDSAAFRYDATSGTTLLPLPASLEDGRASAINVGGDIVGAAWTNDSAGSIAALWRNGQPIDLNTQIPAGSGWVLSNAVAISDNGYIAAFGTFNGSSARALLAPIPEPSGIAVIAGLLLPLRRRR
jgi:hypothetical protein